MKKLTRPCQNLVSRTTPFKSMSKRFELIFRELRERADLGSSYVTFVDRTLFEISPQEKKIVAAKLVMYNLHDRKQALQCQLFTVSGALVFILQGSLMNVEISAQCVVILYGCDPTEIIFNTKK